jgi:hypothetical protein
MLPVYNNAWGLKSGMEAMFAAMKDVTERNEQDQLFEIADRASFASAPNGMPLVSHLKRSTELSL